VVLALTLALALTTIHSLRRFLILAVTSTPLAAQDELISTQRTEGRRQANERQMLQKWPGP